MDVSQDHRSNMQDPRFEDDLVHLDQLILDLEQQPGAMNSLMREHLESARFYRTGGMTQEFDFNLRLAMQLLPEISDSGLRSRIAEFLEARRPE
jgi:hypothetical protein